MAAKKERFLEQLFFISAVLVVVSPVWAIPSLQAYVDGGVAGDIGSDEDTWFKTTDSFDLAVVGSYGPTTSALEAAFQNQ